MNKLERTPHLATYDSDFARWSEEQAALLRSGRFDAVDLENVAEEIESLGRSDKREIENRLKVLLVHLLKSQFQPEKMKPGWKSTIIEQRRRIRMLVKESPSLRSYPQLVLVAEYDFARREAADETGLPLKILPKTCPYSTEEILTLDFYPAAGKEAN